MAGFTVTAHERNHYVQKRNDTTRSIRAACVWSEPWVCTAACGTCRWGKGQCCVDTKTTAEGLLFTKQPCSSLEQCQQDYFTAVIGPFTICNCLQYIHTLDDCGHGKFALWVNAPLAQSFFKATQRHSSSRRLTNIRKRRCWSCPRIIARPYCVPTGAKFCVHWSDASPLK